MHPKGIIKQLYHRKGYKEVPVGFISHDSIEQEFMKIIIINNFKLLKVSLSFTEKSVQ